MNGKEIPFHIAVPKPIKKVEKRSYKLSLYDNTKKRYYQNMGR